MDFRSNAADAGPGAELATAVVETGGGARSKLGRTTDMNAIFTEGEDAVFAVGDRVSFANRFEGRSRRCTVVRILPAEHGIRTYRVRDDSESFERVVDESTLTRAVSSAAEGVFGA
jgi:hypothetical protein